MATEQNTVTSARPTNSEVTGTTFNDNQPATITRNGEPFRVDAGKRQSHERPFVLESKGQWLADDSQLTTDLGCARLFAGYTDAEPVRDTLARGEFAIRALACTTGGLVTGTMEPVDVPVCNWRTAARFSVALAQSAEFEASSIDANDRMYEDAHAIADSPMGALLLQEYEEQRRDEEREPADWVKGTALNTLIARLLYTGRMLERSGRAPGLAAGE